MNKKVFIVLVNYNSALDTLECLESLMRLNYSEFKVVVVDNNSQDNSMNIFTQWSNGNLSVVPSNEYFLELIVPNFKKPADVSFFYENDDIEFNEKITFIKADKNRGFAAGNNIAIRKVLALENVADYFWVLNNDTVVKENSLQLLVKKMNVLRTQKTNVGILGNKLLYYDQPDKIQALGGRYNKYLARSSHIAEGFDLNYVIKMKPDYVVGASMFVDIAFIKDVGLMCEDYFLYFEELDWITRGRKKGWDIDFCYNSIVYHKEGGSIGTHRDAKKRSDLSDYHLLKNRLIFTRKFFSGNYFFIKLGFVVVIINRIKRGDLIKLWNVFKILIRH